ncbi:hypothetical protein KJ969_02805 [Patescibacteria group bacterium]|nr:hypothetical protein [Patescibacteria group bacterium]MBU1922037.1 hypothetical protein [Patescibacteria group bacterium]
MNIEKLKALIQDEGAAWERVLRIRSSFSPDTVRQIEYDSPELALKAANWVVQEILGIFSHAGLDLSQIEPGHGIGHLARDYVNSLMLLNGMDARPGDIFVGAIGGMFHDVGCALIGRYQENERVVRHAEVSALMLHQALNDPVFENALSKAEKIGAAYSVLPHTHYLRPMKIKCEDGITRRIEPYQDMDNHESPILGVWFPRWADRLDCNGPSYVARHFLTIAGEHQDFDGEKFYEVNFAKHMRPLLRSKEEIEANDGNLTMLEHLNVRHQSQTNDSPYGRHDRGKMIELRDTLRQRTEPIISAVVKPEALSQTEQDIILNAWVMFLTHNIEPTDLGKRNAMVLEEMFKKLPPEPRNAWCNGFRECMKHYILWSEPVLQYLDSLKNGWRDLSPICEDVREIIKPYPDWANLILKI